MAVYERQTQRSRPKMTKEEQEAKAAKNKELRSYGYHWTKQHELDRWHLLDIQNGNVEVSEQQAWDTIKSGTRSKPAPVYNYIDRQSAIMWARAIANAKQTEPPTYYLDTETTGTKDHDVIVQIGIANQRGEVLMDTLVHPGKVQIHEKAQETHGIDIMMLEDAPTFADIWAQLEPLLKHGTLVIYNSAFDVRLLEQSAKQYNLTIPRLTTHCLMRQYAAFHGLVKQGINELVFVPQKLESACEYFGLPAGGHNALADAEATRWVLMAMADEKL